MQVGRYDRTIPFLRESAMSYTSGEIVQQGEERYQAELRTNLESKPENHGKMLALDIESGDYELAGDSWTAFSGLKARRPNAVIYILRVGHPTAVRIGAASLA